MKGSRVAKRYARALLGLSEDRNQLEKWGAELERLARIVDTPEVRSGLASPELSHETRIKAAEKIAERLDLSYSLRSLAVVVARHGRLADLTAISRSYQEHLDHLFARARATLTFAHQPERQDIAAVVSGLERLAHKTVIATVKVEEGLLGGVIAEMEGKIYDGSLASRLGEAQRRLMG